MKNLLATIQTKSNYKGLNGKQVKVIQFLGSIVYCEYYCEDRKENVRADFSLKEITKITETY
jgi:hypothetical protein